jgi:hypothetical protein
MTISLDHPIVRAADNHACAAVLGADLDDPSGAVS